MTKFISKYKFHLVLFTFSFLILTRFNIDPDLGWHLAIGNRFLETGEIIRADQFSWTMPGYEWGNSYFLYQILVAYLFKNIGHVLVVVLFGFLGSLAVLIILARRLDFWKLLVVGLGVGVATVNLGVRPHLISFLLFSLLLVFLDKRIFTKNLHVFFWFVLFAIWANFHRGFLVGLLVLAVFMIIDFIWLRSRKKKISVNSRIYCILAAFLGTLATPFGFKLWQSALVLDLTSKENLISIAEWQSPVFYFPSNLLLALTGIIFVYIFFKKIREIPPQWFLLASFIFALAFLTTNFVFFWSAVFIFLATRHLDLKINFKGDFWAKVPIVFSLVAVSLALCLSFLANLTESIELQRRLILDKYPVEAVKLMKQKGFTKGLFNDYGWGGYLDWQLPQTKVFIDGRMASWRKNEQRILADYLAIQKGKCEVAQKYDIKVVLVKKGQKTSCFDDFYLAYEDSVAKVLVRENVDRLR